MKTKVVIALAVVLGIALALLMRPSSPSTPSLGASSTPETSLTPQQPLASSTKNRSQPTFTIGSTTVKTPAPIAAFDSNTFTSTSTYPIVTGSANVSKVGIAIYSEKAGVVGTVIPVLNGHWSYSSSVMLVPGTYKVVLDYGSASTTAKLIVSAL